MVPGKLVTSHYDKGLTDGKRFYYRLKIAVTLLHRGNGVQYRLAAEPFKASDPWRTLPAFGTVIPFNLPATLRHGDRGRVYFQFRSPSGVISRTYPRDITIDFNGDHDGNGGSNRFDPDDDNDGISDEDELFIHGTNPFSVDTDQDGYSDKDELDSGSDPADFSSVPDADGDSYSDLLEKLHGSDAGNPKSTPNLNLNIAEDSEVAVVSFRSVPGVIYRVHNRSELKGRVRDWNKLTPPMPGDGGFILLTVPVDPGREFFGVSFELAPLE